MAYHKQQPHFYDLINVLHMLKRYHDIGIYDAVVREAEFISEDDYYEFAELGAEHVAPIFDFEDVPLNEMTHESLIEEECAEQDIYLDAHYHRVYSFSSPEMREYYRLCRLYEYREKIEPEANPFVRRADSYYCQCLRMTNGYFGAGFDCEKHTTKLMIEVCPDEYMIQCDLIEALHDTLEYYKEHLNALRLELLKGPPVFLPALPAPKGDDEPNGESQDC